MDDLTDFVALSVDVVSAYVSNNSVSASDLPDLIVTVHEALSRAATGTIEEPAEEPKPAVSIKKSVTADFIICLEDGKQFKSLKRHLKVKYNLSPNEYRAKWGLPTDYPMTAKNYSASRSALAKSSGLGRKLGTTIGNAKSVAAKRGRRPA